MNSMERLLSDDLAGLLDRLAASIPEGAVEEIRTTAPRLRTRLDQIEAHLAAERASMVESYGRWRRALEDLENVWALAVWRGATEETTKTASPLAA